MTKAEGNEIRPYGPGKFDTVLDSHVWSMSLDGTDAECGDSSIGIWYGRLNGPFDVTALDLTDAERALVASSIGIIVSEDGNGFVTVDYFTDRDEFERQWTLCEEDAAVYEQADEDNG